MSENLTYAPKLIYGPLRPEIIHLNQEAVVRRCSLKLAFLKISQISQENTWLKSDSNAGDVRNF